MQQKIIGNLNSYVIAPPSGTPPTNMVILLHGYGADGRDLISIADMWRTSFPNTVFISPDAPDQCEASPFGYQWFSLAGLDKAGRNTVIEKKWNIASDFISSALDYYDIDEGNLIIGGFSQGCMMALTTALKRGGICAGVLGYSGMLLSEDSLQIPDAQSMPIHMVHGTDDTVIPVAEWTEAKDKIKKSGFIFSGHTTKGLGHGIDQHGLDSGQLFIQNAFKVNP
jgi:phospholipase/carboxylesterase